MPILAQEHEAPRDTQSTPEDVAYHRTRDAIVSRWISRSMENRSPLPAWRTGLRERGRGRGNSGERLIVKSMDTRTRYTNSCSTA